MPSPYVVMAYALSAGSGLINSSPLIHCKGIGGLSVGGTSSECQFITISRYSDIVGLCIPIGRTACNGKATIRGRSIIYPVTFTC